MTERARKSVGAQRLSGLQPFLWGDEHDGGNADVEGRCRRWSESFRHHQPGRTLTPLRVLSYPGLEPRPPRRRSCAPIRARHALLQPLREARPHLQLQDPLRSHQPSDPVFVTRVRSCLSVMSSQCSCRAS